MPNRKSRCPVSATATLPFARPPLPTTDDLIQALDGVECARAFDGLAVVLRRRRPDLATAVDALEEVPDYNRAVKTLVEVLDELQPCLAWRCLARALLAAADAGDYDLAAWEYAAIDRQLSPREYKTPPPPPRPMVEMNQDERVPILAWRHRHGFGLWHHEDVNLLGQKDLTQTLARLDRNNRRLRNGGDAELGITVRKAA